MNYFDTMDGDVLDCSSAQTQEEIRESFIKKYCRKPDFYSTPGSQVEIQSTEMEQESLFCFVWFHYWIIGKFSNIIYRVLLLCYCKRLNVQYFCRGIINVTRYTKHNTLEREIYLTQLNNVWWIIFSHQLLPRYSSIALWIHF